ncbi:MAG: NAD(P)/FAD-dependent oxidoreductase, partial [Candidatus Kryptoniota bacterium]
GLDVELLSPNEARNIEPSLSANIAGAIFSTMDAHVNPISLCLAYAESAKELGARILLNTEVTKIEVLNKRVTGIETTKGKIKADVVVNSAGVYAPHIAKLVDLDVQIIPRRGQIAVTEPVQKFIKSVMICNRYIKSKFSPDHLDQLGIGFALEQTKSGNILIGSTREFVGYNRKVTPDGIKAILSNAKKFIPEISELNIIRTFAGLRPYTVSGLPILEKSKDIDGFIISAGHEGDGIALSPITGEIVADLITKGKSDLWADYTS